MITPTLNEMNTNAQDAENVIRAIDAVYMCGGSIHFYTCSGQDAVAFRFYRHCREDKYAEWHTNTHGNMFAAILRLYAAVVGLTFEEWMKGGIVADEEAQ